MVIGGGGDKAVELFALNEFYAEAKYMKQITLKQFWLR